MIPGTTLRLEITQQFGRLGLDVEKPSREMRTPAAEMEIQQPAATLEIDQGLGQLNIDGEEARAALGIKTNLRLVSDMAEQGRQIALEVIGDMSAEGDQLMSIEKGMTIGEIAHQKWNSGPMPIEDTGPFSYTPVDISYTPRPTRLDWTVHPNADVQVRPQPVEYSYTPGAVHTYVAQKNWLQIDVRGQHLNMTF
jgi:hypothetical protein